MEKSAPTDVNEERRAFQLSALFETVRELSQLREPVQVMETFLLMSMGSLGTAQAVLLAKNRQTGQETIIPRGLFGQQTEQLGSALQIISDKVIAGRDVLPHQVRIVVMNETPSDVNLPEALRIVVEWFVDGQIFGVLGYGPKVSAQAYDHDDEEFLLRLVSAFLDALKASNINETIHKLNEELRGKNEELSQALQVSQSTQARLDARYFHFKSICDTTRELSGNLDKQKLLSSFLLSVMGTFSAQQGFIALWDRQSQIIDPVVRGYNPESAPSFDIQRMEMLFRSLLHPPFVPAQGEKLYQVLDPELLQPLEVTELPQICAVFMIDENYYGVVGLGNCLAQQEDAHPEEELLPTLLQSFLVSLGNALSFETIEKLNVDLLQKNAELRQTLAELQQSRQTISLLESASNRISSLLQTETLRIKRVTLFDCLALFGISLLLALVFNASSPGGISLRPETWSLPAANSIDVSWARLKHESGGALFLDARPVEFFEQRRIAGAQNLPLNLFEFVYSMRFAMLDPEQDIVVYGRNISRRYDELVAAKLMDRGMSNVRVLDGGLRQWQRNALPVEP